MCVCAYMCICVHGAYNVCDNVFRLDSFLCLPSTRDITNHLLAPYMYTHTQHNTHTHTHACALPRVRSPTAFDLCSPNVVCHLSSLPVGAQDAGLALSGLRHRHTQTMLCWITRPRVHPHKVRYVAINQISVNHNFLRYTPCRYTVHYTA